MSFISSRTRQQFLSGNLQKYVNGIRTTDQNRKLLKPVRSPLRRLAPGHAGRHRAVPNQNHGERGGPEDHPDQRDQAEPVHPAQVLGRLRHRRTPQHARGLLEGQAQRRPIPRHERVRQWVEGCHPQFQG